MVTTCLSPLSFTVYNSCIEWIKSQRLCYKKKKKRVSPSESSIALSELQTITLKSIYITTVDLSLGLEQITCLFVFAYVISDSCAFTRPLYPRTSVSQGKSWSPNSLEDCHLTSDPACATTHISVGESTLWDCVWTCSVLQLPYYHHIRNWVKREGWIYQAYAMIRANNLTGANSALTTRTFSVPVPGQINPDWCTYDL